MPFESFNDMQELYEYSRQSNMKSIYLLGCIGMMGQVPGFSSLRIYLASKLGVDTAINMEEYTDKFFRHCYQGGAETMRKLYDEWRMLDAYNSVTYSNYTGKISHYKDTKRSDYFPRTILQRWRGYIEDSIKAIEPLKTKNPAQYEISYKMIVAERLSWEHIEYAIYRAYMTNAEQEFFKNAIKEDILYLGISHVDDYRKTTETYLAELER